MDLARPATAFGHSLNIPRKQWLWVVSLVLAAHWISIGHRWGPGLTKPEDPLYLPIDLRPVELIEEPKRGQPTSAIAGLQPPLAKKTAPADDTAATPASVAQFEPETIADTAPAQADLPITAPPTTVAEPTPAASTALASAIGAPQVSSPTTTASSDGVVAGAGNSVTANLAEGAEKVTLTVPNVVKFPDSRNWTFATTHKSPKIYAPNLATVFRWKVENGQYDFYLGAGSLYAAFTKLARQSKGTVGELGLQPSEFIATQRDGTRTVSYFDQTNKKVIFGAPGRPPRPLLSGAQDELSAAVQLATMFLGEPQRYQAGERIVMPVVQRTDSQVWIFKVEGEERIEIPTGDIRTIKLTRAPRAQFDTAVTVWLAPEQQYMPVRLRLDYSGDRSDDLLWKGF